MQTCAVNVMTRLTDFRLPSHMASTENIFYAIGQQTNTSHPHTLDHKQ
jgi:hypothetical protein